MWSGRERQHDKVHEEINQSTVKEPAYDCMAQQDGELAAGEAVHGCGAKRYEEMEDDSEYGRCYAALVRLRSEKATGNGLRDENGLVGAVNQDRVSQVEHTHNEPANNNGG
jgi:hypothetical protein